MTASDRVELTVTRKRSDYFWGLLFDAFSNRIFWLAVLIPPVAEGMLHFNRTEGLEAATRALEVATRAATAAGIVALTVIAIFYFAAGLNARAPGHLAPVTYTASSAGVATREGISGWETYRGVIETKALFILRQKHSAVQIIPKRGLSTQAIAGFRNMLRQNLGRRAQVQESAP